MLTNWEHFAENSSPNQSCKRDFRDENICKTQKDKN